MAHAITPIGRHIAQLVNVNLGYLELVFGPVADCAVSPSSAAKTLLLASIALVTTLTLVNPLPSYRGRPSVPNLAVSRGGRGSQDA